MGKNKNRNSKELKIMLYILLWKKTYIYINYYPIWKQINEPIFPGCLGNEKHLIFIAFIIMSYAADF